MNLKTFKFNLPKSWKETSRMGAEGQVVIHVCHINPLANIDPIELEGQPLPSSDPNIAIAKVGIPIPGIRPLNDINKIMKGLSANGIMPPEWTPQRIDELWRGLTKSEHAERPGESDIASDIEIAQYQDEETAWQTLKNKALTPTQGLNVPIPGGITIPGLPNNMSMSDLFQSDMIKQFVPKEQLGQLEKMQSVIKGAQQQMPKIKQDLEKKGIKYREGKLFGCKAVFLDSPNHNPPPTSKSEKSSTKNYDGMGMGGSTDDVSGAAIAPILPPLPKIPQPYSPTSTMCMGILYKNFIIGGPLLWIADGLSPGNTPCYSLTQTKEVRMTTKEEGGTITSIFIVPLPSNYATEGYPHKEGIEEIYKNIISKLGK